MLIALSALLGIIGLALIFVVLGPKEKVDPNLVFDETKLGDDLDAYLVESEAQFSDIREGQQKQIHWVGGRGEQTDLAVVVMHGFSASMQEIRPVPDEVARNLGANLFFQRMKGHARPGVEMAKVYPNDFILDFAEAMAIGRRLGKQVIVIGVSNGCNITAASLGFPDMVKNLAALVFVSPAFALENKLSFIARLSYARYWGHFLAGKEIGFEPMNDGHRKYWTYRYPPAAVVPMLRLMSQNDRTDFSKYTTPVLMMYSPEDKVVSADRIEKVASSWGANASLAKLDLAATDDPERHVSMGDICSPSQTRPAIDAIVKWINGLNLKDDPQDNQDQSKD